MLISVSNMRVIQMIARCKNLKVAAERLHKVPSAVSYTVKKMEEALGVTLFEKRGKLLIPTLAGQYFVNYSKDILSSIDTLVHNTALVNEGIDYRFRVAYNNIVTQRGLTDFIESFTKRFPSTELRTTAEVYNGCWDALYSRRADLVIGAPHYAPKFEGVDSEEIGFISWDFVMAPNHPLVCEVEPLETRQLKNYAAICIKDTSLNIAPMQAWLLEGQKPIFVHDIDTQISLIKRGIGVGYLPHHRVVDILSSGHLVKKAMLEHKPPTRLFHAWCVNRDSLVLDWCIEHLSQPQVKESWCS